MNLPLPVLDWLRRYDRSWLRGDIVAGITLAAYLLPAGLGDASLANLPPQAGLYACLFGGLVFWLFCSSRHTAITVTSAISLLVGASLGEIAGGDTTRFGALAAGTALLVALIAFIAWLAKAGAIVNFISESVMVGFKCGVALFLASTQLPKLFGIHGAHGNFWENSGYFLRHLRETNPASLTIGGAALAVLVLGKIFLKNKPVALFVVVGGIVASGLLGLDARGVKLLGEVPQGLPAIGLPAIHWADLNELLPLAFACFLLGAVETAAIGRMFAAKHGGRLDANQEFLALAAANLAAGLGRGFPVSGGMSQSLVNEGGGARTPLSGAIAAGIILVVVLFFSHLLRALPQPVLAAVVLVAVAGLFKVSTLKQLWRGDRPEFVVAMAAFLGVLGLGPAARRDDRRDHLARAIDPSRVATARRLSRAHSRHAALLRSRAASGQRADSRRADLPARVGPRLFQHGSCARHDSGSGARRSHAAQARRAGPFRRAPRGHAQRAHAGEPGRRTDAAGGRVQAVEARSSVRERLRSEGVDARLGGIDRFTSVADALEAFLGST